MACSIGSVFVLTSRLYSILLFLVSLSGGCIPLFCAAFERWWVSGRVGGGCGVCLGFGVCTRSGFVRVRSYGFTHFAFTYLLFCIFDASPRYYANTPWLFYFGVSFPSSFCVGGGVVRLIVGNFPAENCGNLPDGPVHRSSARFRFPRGGASRDFTPRDFGFPFDFIL